LPTEAAPIVVGRTGAVFVVAINIELAEPNDCAAPELGVCSGSAGMRKAPPSAAAMLSESRLVVASDCYNNILSARTKIEWLIVE
jgi:hypothetical protein